MDTTIKIYNAHMIFLNHNHKGNPSHLKTLHATRQL